MMLINVKGHSKMWTFRWKTLKLHNNTQTHPNIWKMYRTRRWKAQISYFPWRIILGIQGYQRVCGRKVSGNLKISWLTHQISHGNHEILRLLDDLRPLISLGILVPQILMCSLADFDVSKSQRDCSVMDNDLPSIRTAFVWFWEFMPCRRLGVY